MIKWNSYLYIHGSHLKSFREVQNDREHYQGDEVDEQVASRPGSRLHWKAYAWKVSGKRGWRDECLYAHIIIYSFRTHSPKNLSIDKPSVE